MRKISIVLGAVLCMSVSPAPASAGHKNKPATTFAGAGQRQHFSFGGSLKLKNNNTKVTGNFIILAHPAAPETDTLAVSCSFHEFGNATLQGNVVAFDGKGHCKSLSKSGQITKAAAHNHFTFVDNGATGDTIHVTLLGNSGVSIPSGELSFGNFTLTIPAPS